jgi:hypothetical protein
MVAVAVGLAIALPRDGTAQDPVTNLGLPAIAAVGLHGGVARMERASKGEEAGFLLDLGWLRGRSVRIQGELAFLRATLTETLVVEDSTFHGDYFDLSTGVSAVWLGAADGRVSPYALVGVAVHALSSTFGSSVLDRRYNANRFGSHVGAGIRMRFGSSRQALFVEVRRTIADEVDRSTVRLGGLVLMGDLYRHFR